MVSVASLLNPIKSEPGEPAGLNQISPSPCSSHCTTLPAYASPDLSSQQFIKRQKMVKDAAVFTKGKVKGEIRFPPYENFNKETIKEIMKFNVYPLGRITAYPRHIPYNSEKKTFLEKTGRESFEVFQYNFQVPNDEKEYTVMWDYNIGLVRITPFFKCCKYSKTTPAKMLNLNPGLKEITHSITGGALAAQGYWMPWSCALAVCTTFCHHIAPALIPIFGPTFPSQCVSPEAPEHGRMTIRPAITEHATLEAERFRLKYTTNRPAQAPMFIPRSQRSSPSTSPRQRSQLNLHETPSLGRRLRLKRAFGDSPCGTDTGSETASDTGSDRYVGSPITPSSATSISPAVWKKPPTCPTIPRTEPHPLPAKTLSMSPSAWQNFPTCLPAPRTELEPAYSHRSIRKPHPSIQRPTPDPRTMTSVNPWLSAVPRSADVANWKAKRRIKEIGDRGYDGEESGSGSESLESEKARADKEAVEDKKAAMLLMHLNVHDARELGDFKMGELPLFEGPRVKRRRATSM